MIESIIKSIYDIRVIFIGDPTHKYYHYNLPKLEEFHGNLNKMTNKQGMKFPKVLIVGFKL